MPRLYGERIMLREYRSEDLPHIREWVNDPEIVNNLSDVFLFPHSFSKTEGFLHSMIDGKADAKGFIIAHKQTEAYIGQVDLIDINWKNRFALMGIVIPKSSNRSKGYGYEAICVLQEFVFNRLNLNRLELELHDYNVHAYKCYLKCGFKEEGRIRQNFYMDGKYGDTIVMGILKSEYDALRKSE